MMVAAPIPQAVRGAHQGRDERVRARTSCCSSTSCTRRRCRRTEGDRRLNVLKPALARGDPVHRATTFDEYRKHREGRRARRFRPSPSPAHAGPDRRDHQGLRDKYETTAACASPTAIKAVDLSERLSPAASSPTSRSTSSTRRALASHPLHDRRRPGRHRGRDREARRREGRGGKAADRARFERATALEQLKKKEIQRQWREKSQEVGGVVDEDVVAEVVSKMTGVPLRSSSVGGPALLQLEAELHKVISQTRPSRPSPRPSAARPWPPIPSGPWARSSSSGPPESRAPLKACSRVHVRSEDSLVHLDMGSTWRSTTSTASSGAPATSDTWEGGQLQAIRRKPPSSCSTRSRAHPDVQHAPPDHGGGTTHRLVRALVDFRSTVMIMTSNIGADLTRAAAGSASRSAPPRSTTTTSGHPDEGDEYFFDQFINGSTTSSSSSPRPRRPGPDHRVRVGKVSSSLAAASGSTSTSPPRTSSSRRDTSDYGPGHSVAPSAPIEDPLSEMLWPGTSTTRASSTSPVPRVRTG